MTLMRIFVLILILITFNACRNPLASSSTAAESYHPGIPSQITQIQTSALGTQPGGLTVSTSFATPPTAGNAVLIYTWSYSNVAAIGIPATSCTDNKGNSYRIAVTSSDISGANRLATSICYVTNVPASTGPFTVTISPTSATGTTQIQVLAIEYAGMASDPVDKTMVNNGTSAAASTGTTGITTRDNELIATVVNSAAGVNPIIFTSLNGFSILGIQPNCSGFACGQASSKTAAFTGTQVENWNVNTVAFYAAVIATFKPQ